MKEYKIMYMDIKMSKEKTMLELEQELNALAKDRWELKVAAGPYMILERTSA